MIRKLLRFVTRWRLHRCYICKPGPCDPYGCVGPCYDLCACKHCWFRWPDYSFRTKLGWRIRHIWSDRKTWL